MLLYILFLVFVLLDIWIIIKIYNIIKSIYLLKQNLIKNTCIIICNKPYQNYSNMIILYIIYHICHDLIFDINDHDNIIKKLKNKSKYNIILDTNGGNISSNDILINFIIISKINLNIYVNKKAQSAGTLLSFSATQLYIDKDAYLSPTDPQITFDNDIYSIRSFIELCENKDKNNITDKYLLSYYENKKLYYENLDLIKKLLKNKFKKNITEIKREDFIFELTSGMNSHHMPLSGQYISKFLNINLNLPLHILNIYNLYDNIMYFVS